MRDEMGEWKKGVCAKERGKGGLFLFLLTSHKRRVIVFRGD